jgi:hypothetical protein
LWWWWRRRRRRRRKINKHALTATADRTSTLTEAAQFAVVTLKRLNSPV